MEVLLIYSLVLLLAVLISAHAERSIVSTTVLFLITGMVCGPGVLNLIVLDVTTPVVGRLLEFALVAVLLTDGMRVGARELAGAWRLPGRALLLGTPITFLVTALCAVGLTHLPWRDCVLLGAALCPTDPVFASAIVGREVVPERIRKLLNVESGLNDGLALPFVLVLLSLAGGEKVSGWALAGEVLAGIALGIVIPWIALQLEGSWLFAATTAYKPLYAVAIGLIVLATASLTHSNEFLATFTTGVVIASRCHAIRDSFHRFGSLLADLLKFAALLVFGAVISPEFLAEIPWSGYLFAGLVLLAARPIALVISLFGSRLSWKEWTVAAWFGPKGFASVIYGLLILKSDVPWANEVFHLIALVVIASIVAHSSTDVLMVRLFEMDDRPQFSQE